MSAVKELVEYWKDFYKRRMNANQIVNELLSPLKEYPNKQFGTVYHSVMDAIGDQSTFYPEPYFGFLEQMDPEHDVLGLFMNPGPVKHEDILEWNEEVIRQYTEWGHNYFLSECGVMDDQNLVPKSFPMCNCFLKDRHEKGCNIWRRKRYLEIRKDFRLNLRFLHTMEMFPFHSKVWDGRIKSHLKKIADLDFMKLTLNAVQELSIQRKVKCIMAVGQVWESIFDKKIDWYSVTKKQFSGSIGVRVIHYQASPNSSPVIVMVRRTQAGVRFTENIEAQKFIRNILGTEKVVYNQFQEILDNEQGVPQLRELVKNVSYEKEELIIETLLNKLPPQLNHPELLSGKIYSPTKNQFKYIHLWYKNNPWHENYFSFHIHVYKGLAEPKIEIRFGMNYKQLNFSRQISSAMIQELKKIAVNYDFKTKGKENVSFNIVRLCTGPSAVDEAALLLSIIINNIKEASDLIIKTTV